MQNMYLIREVSNAFLFLLVVLQKINHKHTDLCGKFKSVISLSNGKIKGSNTPNERKPIVRHFPMKKMLAKGLIL